MEIEVRNEKWEEDKFFKVRQEVLSMWPTGKEVDLEEAIEYHKSLPDHKVFWKVAEKLYREGRAAVFPRAGTPILEQEIALNKALIDSGMVFVPVTPDSYCRLLQFEKAEQGLKESIRTGQPKLNGYPTVIHGVKNTRKVVDACGGALCQRLTNLDTRLMAEIAFASGMTSSMADPLYSFDGYEKHSTVEQNIGMCQYVMRLIGYYAERGVILTQDIDGPGLYLPPSTRLAGVVAEALLGAKQGVKSVTVWASITGLNMVQAIAAARVTRRILREYLDKLGYQDIITPAIWGGGLPSLPAPCVPDGGMASLCYGAVVAGLAGVQGFSVRTTDEAAGIPTAEVHAKCHRTAKWVVDLVREQKITLDTEETRAEERIVEIEARAILDKVLELGDGDVAVGLVRAYDAGVMDSPFSPNVHIKGKALWVFDNSGAIRYLNYGNLPLPKEAREYNERKLAQREKAQGRKLGYQTVIEDIWALSKGRVKGGLF